MFMRVWNQSTFFIIYIATRFHIFVRHYISSVAILRTVANVLNLIPRRDATKEKVLREVEQKKKK